MNALIKSLLARTRTALEVRSPGYQVDLPGSNTQHEQPVPVAVESATMGSGVDIPAPASTASAEMHDEAIPIRICPHCGYEIRTWILGDLTCTRCENDIRTGEGMPAPLYYRIPGISVNAGSGEYPAAPWTAGQSTMEVPSFGRGSGRLLRQADWPSGTKPASRNRGAAAEQ
jgi:hypothetical protein